MEALIIKSIISGIAALAESLPAVAAVFLGSADLAERKARGDEPTKP